MILDIAPVSVKRIEVNGARRITTASDNIDSPKCPNLAVLIKFKATPNGRTKSIIAKDGEMIHVEPASLTISVQSTVLTKSGGKYASAGHRTWAVTAIPAQEISGLYRIRVKPHRGTPSADEIAEFLDD